MFDRSTWCFDITIPESRNSVVAIATDKLFCVISLVLCLKTAFNLTLDTAVAAVVVGGLWLVVVSVLAFFRCLFSW